MIQPGNLPLRGNRYTPLIYTLNFQGVDLTDAEFEAQVRDRKDGGAVRADLPTVVIEEEGILLVSAGLVEDVMTSVVEIRIDEATMAAMPYGTEQGLDDAYLWWDLHITPDGGVKQVYLYGVFTVTAGVTYTGVDS